MKRAFCALLCTMGMAVTQASHANVVYDFKTTYQPTPDSFSIVMLDYIKSDAYVPVADMQSCHVEGQSCLGAHFYVNAHDHGLSLDPVPVIELDSYDALYDVIEGQFFYFNSSVFVTPGSYNTLYDFNPAVLTVAEQASTQVPEPTPAALLLLGPALFAFFRKRCS